jgi:hypothetical protein
MAGPLVISLGARSYCNMIEVQYPINCGGSELIHRQARGIVYLEIHDLQYGQTLG